ncbi:MAG: SDR family oxidoreductase [Bdellovibrionota bacterium]
MSKELNFSLNGKNILVTGAAGILGKTFVQGLLTSGANVALLDLTKDSLDKVASEMKVPSGQKTLVLPCDITDENQVKTAIERIEKEWGQIHVLFNNAASKSSDLNKFFAPFEEFPLETWREVMAVNIDGMFLVAKHVGKHMVKNSIQGSIIQTASIYGVVAPDQGIYVGSEYLGRQINTPAVYSASKAAVIGLTQYLAAYWGPKGIRVNTLTPGGMQSGQNEKFVSNYSKKVPLGRMGEASELVGALVFLASDVSSYVTGQNLVVDGGFTVW